MGCRSDTTRPARCQKWMEISCKYQTFILKRGIKQTGQHTEGVESKKRGRNSSLNCKVRHVKTHDLGQCKEGLQHKNKVQNHPLTLQTLPEAQCWSPNSTDLHLGFPLTNKYARRSRTIYLLNGPKQLSLYLKFNLTDDISKIKNLAASWPKLHYLRLA